MSALLMAGFIVVYVYSTVGRIKGKYKWCKQWYPDCPLKSLNFVISETFLDMIGNGRCEYPRGEETNIIECG